MLDFILPLALVGWYFTAIHVNFNTPWASGKEQAHRGGLGQILPNRRRRHKMETTRARTMQVWGGTVRASMLGFFLGGVCHDYRIVCGIPPSVMNQCCAEPSIYSVGQISIGFFGGTALQTRETGVLDGHSACVHGGLTCGAAFGV